MQSHYFKNGLWLILKTKSRKTNTTAKWVIL